MFPVDKSYEISGANRLYIDYLLVTRIKKSYGEESGDGDRY